MAGVEGLLPRVLYRYALDLHRVLDLTDDELVADDWAMCQQLGAEAHAAGDQGIRTVAATGVDTVPAVFPELLGGSLTGVERSNGGTTSLISRDGPSGSSSTLRRAAEPGHVRCAAASGG